VVPGDQLELHSRLVAQRAMMVKFECVARVDGELACSASLSVVEQINEGAEPT
jgi:3-hydroxyacyl-[acyl-carrier-protein] dehydratase